LSAVPPYNEEAEEHVIGACLSSTRALEDISEVVSAEHFYLPSHGRIFTAALGLMEAGSPVDVVTISERLEQKDAGKAKTIAASGYPVGNVLRHAEIVRDYSTRREMVRVGQEIARCGFEPSDDIGADLDTAEQLVYRLTSKAQVGELSHVREGLDDTFALLERPGGEVVGTPTGLPDLDRLTAGFQPGQLVVIAARPSMGKSALAIGQALHAAVTRNEPVAFFTLEMSREEINQRLLSALASVNLHRIRTRIGLTPIDRSGLDEARTKLEAAPLYVDDTPSVRLTEIRARARRLKAREPDLALICIDYLQLMLSESDAQNRNLEISQITRGLKVIARELEVPVVALSQLSRQVEYRHDKRPMLSDLRDSGAIEQDADLVIFIYREGYYTKEDDTEAELLVAKHRNGPTGAPKVYWSKETASFSSLQPVPF
jgi:replicative DNA helicase